MARGRDISLMIYLCLMIGRYDLPGTLPRRAAYAPPHAVSPSLTAVCAYAYGHAKLPLKALLRFRVLDFAARCFD